MARTGHRSTTARTRPSPERSPDTERPSAVERDDADRGPGGDQATIGADEAGADEEERSVVTVKSTFATAVAALCVYEMIAAAVNAVAGEHALPSLLGAISRLTVRRVLRFLSPQWLRTAGLLAAGLGAGLIQGARHHR